MKSFCNVIVSLNVIITFLLLNFVIWQRAGGPFLQLQQACTDNRTYPAFHLGTTITHTLVDLGTTTNHTPIDIFYNLFVSSKKDLKRVSAIVYEQLSRLKPELHGTVHMNSIGAATNLEALNLPPHISAVVNWTHHETGEESVTLHALWQFCRKFSEDSSPQQNRIVVYLHSKGSFHPTKTNKYRRQYVTEGALSPECATVSSYENQCNICSSRFSPLPHPHVSGNMWLARCNYIAKLVDPQKFQAYLLQQMPEYPDNRACLGTGRFAHEHWVHSHPTVMPCDVDNSSGYTWGHGTPGINFQSFLRQAPRFPLVRFQHRSCKGVGESLRLRLTEHLSVYHEAPPPTWYGWTFYDPRS